jgi:hypothetical protein
MHGFLRERNRYSGQAGAGRKDLGLKRKNERRTSNTEHRIYYEKSGFKGFRIPGVESLIGLIVFHLNPRPLGPLNPDPNF